MPNSVNPIITRGYAPDSDGPNLIVTRGYGISRLFITPSIIIDLVGRAMTTINLTGREDPPPQP